MKNAKKLKVKVKNQINLLEKKNEMQEDVIREQIKVIYYIKPKIDQQLNQSSEKLDLKSNAGSFIYDPKE